MHFRLFLITILLIAFFVVLSALYQPLPPNAWLIDAISRPQVSSGADDAPPASSQYLIQQQELIERTHQQHKVISAISRSLQSLDKQQLSATSKQKLASLQQHMEDFL